MGDPRRFDLLAKLITAEFPDYREWAIADVAGGKGYLQAALRQLGYRRVTTIDKRRSLAKNRPGQHWGFFDCNQTPEGYRLIVGMHPDQATDHIILYAVKYHVPFVVCPCCVKPTASISSYRGNYSYWTWINHLKTLAAGMRIDETMLSMQGKKLVLIGRPKAHDL